MIQRPEFETKIPMPLFPERAYGTGVKGERPSMSSCELKIFKQFFFDELFEHSKTSHDYMAHDIAIWQK